jgi:hypothetical protein
MNPTIRPLERLRNCNPPKIPKSQNPKTQDRSPSQQGQTQTHTHTYLTYRNRGGAVAVGKHGGDRVSVLQEREEEQEKRKEEHRAGHDGLIDDPKFEMYVCVCVHILLT